MTAAAPALAASGTSGTAVPWYAESRTNLSLPDYSNNGYTATYVHHTDPVQPGYLKVMRWVYNGTFDWRPALGVGVAMNNPTIVFTVADDQTLGTVSATHDYIASATFTATLA